MVAVVAGDSEIVDRVQHYRVSLVWCGVVWTVMWLDGVVWCFNVAWRCSVAWTVGLVGSVVWLHGVVLQCGVVFECGVDCGLWTVVWCRWCRFVSLSK